MWNLYDAEISGMSGFPIITVLGLIVRSFVRSASMPSNWNPRTWRWMLQSFVEFYMPMKISLKLYYLENDYNKLLKF